MMYTLKQPALLEIKTPHGICVGGSQEWYPNHWQRMSGCGPTAASNMMWYLAGSRLELSGLCDIKSGERRDFLALMIEMFGYITPGTGGVNTSDIFTDGALKYANAHGVALRSHVLEIPKLFGNRPSLDEIRTFILTSLENDCPIAFLNLSNGNQHHLDNWHWVTVIALDPDTMTVRISDQGKGIEVDMAAWLKTTLLGGALVYFTAER